jgi:tetratricopeptide (TPR) repeat protein
MARYASRLALIFAILASAATTRAQTQDAISRARTHFEAGRALYNLGNYTDAIREFSAGYQLAPRPQFLVNLGQCYRKLGGLENLTKARDLYRKFLDEASPGDPDREQVKSVLTDLEQEIAATPAAAPPPPPKAAEPEPQQNALVASAPPAKKPFIKRHWWIIPVTIVAAAGLAVGIYFAVKPSGQVDCGSASLGCIDGSGAK